jgi:hypothetical protein
MSLQQIWALIAKTLSPLLLCPHKNDDPKAIEPQAKNAKLLKLSERP